VNKQQNENALILEELKATGGNISKVARSLGIDYFALKSKFPNTHPPIGTFKSANGPEPVDIRVLGRPGFEQYVIAVKRAGSFWPSKYKDVIAEARARFDAGTHEMFQTPNSGWVVQYLIPRRHPTARRSFFSSMGAV
jgi:hypothetical protein